MSVSSSNAARPSKVARAFIAIGSNIDPDENIWRALSHLEQLFGELKISSVYQSEAVGFEGPDFLNLVVAVDTSETPLTIKTTLKGIEDRLGRQRSSDTSFDSRTIDLDLILYGDEVMSGDELCLPSEDILKYGFVLVPLAEIAGEQIHPVIGRSFCTLRDKMPETDRQFVSVRPPSTAST